MKRNSLGWWLAAINVLIVVLVAAGVSWFAIDLLERLAEVGEEQVHRGRALQLARRERDVQSRDDGPRVVDGVALGGDQLADLGSCRIGGEPVSRHRRRSMTRCRRPTGSRTPASRASSRAAARKRGVAARAQCARRSG